VRHCINCWCYITSNSSIWQYHCNDSLDFCGHDLFIMSQLFCMLFGADVRLMWLTTSPSTSNIRLFMTTPRRQAGVRRGIARVTLNLNFALWPFYLRGRTPAKRRERSIAPGGIRTPDRPTRNQVTTPTTIPRPPVWLLHFGSNSKNNNNNNVPIIKLAGPSSRTV